MRYSVLFLSMAAGAMCTLCANGHCSERKGGSNAADRVWEAQQPAQKATPVSGQVLDSKVLSPLLDASFQTATTEHFVLFHKAGADYVPAACRTLEYAYGHFYDAFARAGFDLSRSKDRLVWICFPQKSGFSRYALQAEGMDLSWLDGYYSTLTNRVAIVQTDQKTSRREEPAPASTGGVGVAVAANRLPRDGVLPISAAGQRFDVTRLTMRWPINCRSTAAFRNEA